MNYIKRVIKYFCKRLIVFETDNKNHFYTKDYLKNKNYKIGDYTYGKPTVLFENENAKLTIGKFCSIADKVTIYLGGNHRIDWITTYPFNALNSYFPEASHLVGHPATKGNVNIGNDVWIGNNVIIMSGVTIEDGAVIAVGSIVTKNVGPYEVWGGNPAKFIKFRFSNEKIIKLCNLRWWDWDINKIKKSFDDLCSTNFDNL